MPPAPREDNTPDAITEGQALGGLIAYPWAGDTLYVWTGANSVSGYGRRFWTTADASSKGDRAPWPQPCQPRQPHRRNRRLEPRPRN
jgi:hypothetical protein